MKNYFISKSARNLDKISHNSKNINISSPKNKFSERILYKYNLLHNSSKNNKIKSIIVHKCKDSKKFVNYLNNWKNRNENLSRLNNHTPLSNESKKEPDLKFYPTRNIDKKSPTFNLSNIDEPSKAIIKLQKIDKIMTQTLLFRSL